MRRLLGTLVTAACAALLLAPPATAGHDQQRRLEVRQSVIDPAASFRGLDALDRRTAWVSGARVVGEDVTGVVYRTHDGGRTWDDVTPPGAEGLQFRDVEITGKRTVTVLAIGEGGAPGSTAPPTTAAPGPRPSATTSRRPSTTASTSTATAAPAW